MDERQARLLRIAAATLVFATAVYHFQWGLPRALIFLQGLDTLLSAGVFPDPRPFVFVVFALALFAGPYLVTRDVIGLRRAYQLGALAMVLAILAWMGWHLSGHGAFLPGAPGGTALGADHTGPVNTVLTHYLTKPVEATVKTIELFAALAFGALLRWDPAVRTDRSAEE